METNKPNPIMTLLILILTIGCWGTSITQWAHGNDHWALFWFAWCMTGSNLVLVRLLKYRGVL